MSTPAAPAHPLRVAATDLARRAAGLRLGFAGRGGWQRAWLGQSAHAAYQQRAQLADPHFEREVSLDHSLAVGAWQVTVHGRADGIREELQDGAPHLLVEELKTRPRTGSPAPAVHRAHRLQVAIYAWMLRASRPGPVRAELVWIDADGNATGREPVEIAGAELEHQLAPALEALVAEAEENAALRARRRRAAPTVRFPFELLRPGQQEIQQGVAEALERGEHLLLQAGTGTGKTAAVLTPALAHVLATGRRLFFLTASTLQQRLALETLEMLAPDGLATGVRLRVRERMCANHELFCHEAVCGFAADYADKCAEGQLVNRVLAKPVAGSERIFAIGREAAACPFELSLDAARQAPVTVCDFNYAFDPAVALYELHPKAELGDAVLIVDEAHRLPERMRDALSPELSGEQVKATIAAAALGSGGLFLEQRELCEQLHRALCAAAWEAGDGSQQFPEGTWLESAGAIASLASLGAEFDAAVGRTLDQAAGAPLAGPAAAFLSLAAGLRRLLEPPRAHSAEAVLVGVHSAEPCVKRLCLDPAPALARVFGGAHAAIALSATLSPTHFYQDLLGFAPERTASLRVAPPPERIARQRLVVDPGVSSRYRRRDREIPRMARRLCALADASAGPVLALAGSFATTERLEAALDARALRVVRERPGASESERAGWLATLREPGPTLLLAIAGGALAEGVDYAETPLRAVAVLGPCLPPPEAARQLLEEHYEERFGAGFEYAYALPGLTRVIQSAGRLLRTDRDRGVIALYGERFLQSPYRDLIPEEWLDGGAIEDRVGDPAAVAKEFFGDG